MNERLKKIIFKKLYKDLSHVEIIPFKDSIWFIDREKRYWYFEYTKKGILWWRYAYFTDFFQLFSMEPEEFQWVLSEWVEEVLNCKVNTTNKFAFRSFSLVEEVLNCKVNTPRSYLLGRLQPVEEVLNCKVITTSSPFLISSEVVEEVLNCKVIKPYKTKCHYTREVNDVLNYKVNATYNDRRYGRLGVEEVLSIIEVEEVLNNT